MTPRKKMVIAAVLAVGLLAGATGGLMIREALRQTYYGGGIIDMRAEPPSVTSDLKIKG
jgi:hypothetical protein